MFRITADKPADCEPDTGFGFSICRQGRHATSRVSGFPFAIRESVSNPEDGTDDFVRGISKNLRLNLPGAISKDHYDEHFNMNVITYPAGITANILFWAAVLSVGTLVFIRRKS